jgi:alpha-tubulin suppressor-like RCC1 family protein
MITQRDVWRHSLRSFVAACAVGMASACTDDPTGVRSAGSAARLELTAEDELAMPGAEIDTIEAAVSDSAGVRVEGVAVAWSVERGGGSVRALAPRTDTRGIARAIWTMGPTSGENTLMATVPGLRAHVTALATVGFPATAVALGGTHACAITPLGSTYCWGENTMGQLGIGSNNPTLSLPVRVGGGLTFTSLVAGTFHACGLTESGEAYCWGGGPFGQLGSYRFDAAGPTRVAGPYLFTALASGTHHTCGLATGGLVVCWGDNTAGELGDGSDRSSPIPFGNAYRAQPAPIADARSFVALAASYNSTCAITTTTGQTFCWGGNASRELGTASGNCRMLADPYYIREDWDWPCSTKPVPIDSPAELVSLTGSGTGFCGLTTDGALLCWGATLSLPRVIPDARVSTAWSLGNIVCGLENDAVKCWGLWNGGVPTPHPFGDSVVLVNLTSTGSSTCGLSQDRPALVYCWGSNDAGQLGDGTKVYRPLPVRVGLPRRP